jgi:hypothetical protein
MKTGVRSLRVARTAGGVLAIAGFAFLALAIRQ